VDVPEIMCLFKSVDELHLFWNALDHIQAKSLIPQGFTLNNIYESTETFHTSCCQVGLTVPLDYEVWYPCILLWCQALDLLKCFPLIVRDN
jgi:hypothetical protein